MGDLAIYKRWAFLAGEGTLSAAEVVAWAQELVPGPLPMPAEVSDDERLVVSVSPWENNQWRTTA